MRILITGGCGFLGTNLADAGLREGHEVTVLDDLSRFGSERNLAWLTERHGVPFLRVDVTDAAAVRDAVSRVRPEAVFHVAGQVAMTSSLADPRRDFEVNAGGTLNVLEALRSGAPEALLVYSSTNKVYGDLEDLVYEETPTRWVCPDYPRGFDETLPLSFRTPYGCSKGSAEQYALDYARSFGLKTVVFRHSSMYGPRQFATFDQGWIGWFCDQVLRQSRGLLDRPFTIAGTGKQVRDVLHASDMSALYLATLSRAKEIAGRVFNVGGGMDNSLSLLELFTLLGELTGHRAEFEAKAPRSSDQRVFVANVERVGEALDWTPRMSPRDGLADMLRFAETLLP